MNVAVVSFYESNSRYYHFLEQRLKERYPNSYILQLCLYPSAVQYCKANQLRHIDLAQEVRTMPTEVDVDLTEFLRYHYKIMPEYKKQIDQAGAQYYHYFSSFFDKNDVEVIVCIGDERMFASIPSYFAKKKGVKVLYFEPGPFATMIFDAQGVNCKMEVSNIPTQEIEKVSVEDELLAEFYNTSNTKVKFYDKDKFAYFRKIKDVLYSVPPKLMKKYIPVELQTGEYFFESLIYLRKRLLPKKKKASNKEYGKYIFFALQVPMDVQMVIHSPLYSEFYTLLKDIYESIPEGYNLVVREHPMNIGRYDQKLYQFIENHDRIYLDNDTPIDKLIINSEIVVINNSTVGVEALKYGKTVVTLGKTYYSQVVYNVVDKKELVNTIKTAIEQKIPQELINKYLCLLYKNYLVKDHYKNLKYYNLDKVINIFAKQVDI